MKAKSKVFLTFFSFFILLNLVLNTLNSNLAIYTKENSLSLTIFYLIYENKTIPDSCKLEVIPLNKTAYSCYGSFSIKKLNNNETVILKAFYTINNKTKTEEKKIKFNDEIAYVITPKELILTGNNVLTITTQYNGFLKIGSDVFQLNPGTNKINLTKFYPIGALPITLKLCDGRFCKVFKDFLIIKPSPAYCDVQIVENNFPYYLKFDLIIKDQDGNVYNPKIKYFDSDLLPYLKERFYYIDFPTFYPAGIFDLKIYIDGRLCEKRINLNYSKFFYALADEFQKKVKISEVFLKNPYDRDYNITIIYELNNKTESKKIELGNYLINLKLPFSNYTIIYENKTIYTFQPQIVEEKKFEKTISYIRKIIFILLLIVVFAFLFIYLLPYEDF
jgi:hypothetical protein